jgi:phage host-nuclease inhibitor protein Gam
MSVSDLSAGVSAKLIEARNGLAKALDITNEILQMEKEFDELESKLEAEFLKKNEEFVSKMEPLEKSISSGKNVVKTQKKLDELSAELEKLAKELDDRTETARREFSTKVETLTVERDLLQDKAMKALSLKSGLDIISKTQKQREINQKVNELLKKQRVKVLGKELDEMKKQTSLATKKM